MVGREQRAAAASRRAGSASSRERSCQLVHGARDGRRRQVAARRGVPRLASTARPSSAAAASRTARGSPTGRSSRSSSSSPEARRSTRSPRASRRCLGDAAAALERRDRLGASASCSSASPPSRPLVCVFDDLHWGEETFLDLVEHVADLSRDAPILLLCMARPGAARPAAGLGGGKVNATTVLLEPLGADETDER